MWPSERSNGCKDLQMEQVCLVTKLQAVRGAQWVNGGGDNRTKISGVSEL